MRFLFLIPIVFVTSCSEPTEVFTFDCTVVDAVSQQPLPDVAVTLEGKRVSGGTFNSNFETLGTAVSDAQGRFVIEVDKDVFSTFRIRLSRGGLFGTSASINPDDVPISGAYSNTFSMQPVANVTLRVRNLSGAWDIDFSLSGSDDGCTECCSNLDLAHQGQTLDTTLACRMYGESTLTLVGNVLDSDSLNQLLYEQYVTISGDTLHISLDY